jgi:predicted nucleic acid-binding protein
MNRVFLDTSYAVALATPKDHHHRQALALAGDLERLGTRMVTTRAVLLEIGNSLAKGRHRASGVALLEFLEADPKVEIVPLSEDLYRRGLELFKQRRDKEWGLIDCASFVVMRDHGLQESLTTDEHFDQAGFRALMARKGFQE